MVTGTRYLLPKKDPKFVYKALQVFWPKEYIDNSTDNDIGLIYTDRDINFDQNVKMIGIAENCVQAGKIADFAGWGLEKVSYNIETYFSLISIPNFMFSHVVFKVVP